MEVIRIEPGISLIGLTPPVAGFEGFLGTYVVEAGKIALIDVGPTSTLENLFVGLAELKVKPEEVDYVLCTHIHIDHSGGAGGALKYMPKATCVVHEKGRYHLANPAKLWKGSLQTLGQLAVDYGEPEAVNENRLIAAREGMVIDLGGIKLEVILTPGHAAHHMSFLDRQNGRLFVGEAAGIYYADYGRARPATPTPFDLKQALSSADKLIAAEPSRIFYSHFGVASTGTEHLKLFKNQLLLWAEIVANHANGHVEWQEILSKLIAQDESIDYLERLPEDRLRIELNFIKNSIAGLSECLGKT
jgi:glyoxylase-like metal-dependent hydrolase (beta-lactamase superfamily II)